MREKEKQIKAFFSDEKKLRALVNDEKFIDKVSDGKATDETYKEELKKFGLKINTGEAKQIENTVSKIFETPTEKLDDDFLKNIAGGVSNDNTRINNENVNAVSSSSKGLSDGAIIGMSVGIPVAAWLGSGIGCAIAASVYRKRKDKDKFHKCATAAFHILNAPLLPIEGGLLVAYGVAIGDAERLGVNVSSGGSFDEDFENFFTHPVEHFFGVDVE